MAGHSPQFFYLAARVASVLSNLVSKKGSDTSSGRGFGLFATAFLPLFFFFRLPLFTILRSLFEGFFPPGCNELFLPP